MQRKLTIHHTLIVFACTIIVLLLAVHRGAAQFVELNAEIETVTWDGHGKNPPSVNSFTYTARCVVGTNTWLIEGDFIRNAKATFWFTGTNIIERTVITHETPGATTQRLSKVSGFAMSSPPVGRRNTRTFESADGNPGRPVRVADLLFEPGRVAWLAYCSGSFLKRDGRHIPLPRDLWKEYLPPSWETWEKTTVFEDELGLPERLVLYTGSNQPVLQYRATLSTNVLGWTFPLEFYLAQYKPAGSNAWELDFTAKGKITVIGEGTEPQIPTEEPKSIERGKRRWLNHFTGRRACNPFA
jgi:hypothetical protein